MSIEVTSLEHQVFCFNPVLTLFAQSSNFQIQSHLVHKLNMEAPSPHSCFPPFFTVYSKGKTFRLLLIVQRRSHCCFMLHVRPSSVMQKRPVCVLLGWDVLLRWTQTISLFVRLCQRSHTTELLFGRFRKKKQQLPQKRINSSWCDVLLPHRSCDEADDESYEDDGDAGKATVPHVGQWVKPFQSGRS